MINKTTILIIVSLILLETRNTGCTNSNTYFRRSCNNTIFCDGALLHTVSMARIFDDSKTFVDKRLLNSPDVTLENFAEFMEKTKNKPSKKEVEAFVDNNFADGDELEQWIGPDYNPEPPFVRKIDDLIVRNFTKHLVELWLPLGRRVKSVVLKNPDLYSIIAVPNGFIVPGGRFRELYYWDSYWIIKGLMICGMTQTAKGMLDNFIAIIKKFGFIPNGTRIYYLNRSQPPVVTMIAGMYISETNDLFWVRKNTKVLDVELLWWLEHRVIEVDVQGKKYSLARYYSDSGFPRPESYREDVETCELYDPEQKKECYAHLKAGAESGWDFSSRWFFDEKGEPSLFLKDVNTHRVIPVDLNSFLCFSFKIIAGFYEKTNNNARASFWNEKYLEWLNAIDKVLYNDNDGIWYDYDIINNKQRRHFYASNLFPLWTDIYEPKKLQVLGKKAATYIRRMGLMKYKGGIPTSMINTGQQWDYPNAWPPLQSVILHGLYRSKDADARHMALELARRWIEHNIKGLKDSGNIFEKYHVEDHGLTGLGGEYVPQVGFGWTNGAAIEIISNFYKRVKHQ